jgi:hypothetical protein
VDPAPAITTGNGVTRDCTDEGQGLWGIHKARSWLLLLHLGQDIWGQGESLQSLTCNHQLPIDPHVNLRILTLGSCHQAQEKTQWSHLLDHCPAFPRDLSPVWGQSCELLQAWGVT